MKLFSMVMFCITCILTNLYGQKQNNHWAFGFREGLDFNSGTPVAIQTRMGTGGYMNYEGSATVSDRYTGQLLFYTQGSVVWDRNHNIMPNGQNLSTDPVVWSSAQAALIIPILSTPDQYYLFTLGQTATGSLHGLLPNSAMLSYSVIDMSLNGGLGDVVAGRKNIHMDSILSEQMIAIAGTDCNIWLLVHDKSNVFKAYEVTANGTIRPPVLSAVGAGFPAGNNPGEAATLMKASPDGKKISAAYRYHNRIGFYAAELYDFDAATGIVSNPLGLRFMNTDKVIYGTCFSPDNSKLYFQESGSNVRIYQFNLSAGTPSAIQASQTLIGTNNHLGGDMQLAPDGKIYVCGVTSGGFSLRGNLYAINAPNQLGVACQLQNTPVPLIAPDSVSYGLPNLVVYPPQDTVSVTTALCEPADSFRLSAPPGFYHFEWNDGTTDSVVVIRTQGTYWVRSVNACMLRTDTFFVEPNTVQVDLGADIEVCAGSSVLLQLQGGVSSGSYRWSTGAATASIQVSQSGGYWLRVDIAGCVATDTVNVTMHEYPVVSLGNDTGTCDVDVPYVLRNNVEEAGVSYLWSNGLSDTVMGITKTGKYWLELSRYGCVSSDTIHVEVVPAPYVYAGNDSIICEQFPTRIGTEVAGASYLWSTGATTPYIEVNESDEYILEVNLRGCRVRDTVIITAMPVPDIDLGEDGDICAEEVIVLDGSYGTNSRYDWNTGETTGSISVTSAGTYAVTVTSEHHCVGSDTIVLSYYPNPLVYLGMDTSVCEETPLVIAARTVNADSVRWSDGSIGKSLIVMYGDRYIATGINKCGTGSDTIEVRQIFCDIWVPNAFTPNGDGVNDVFRVLGNIGRLEGFGLSVYNRWGERVFHTQDKYAGWDGFYKGIPGQLGTYVYLLQYSIGGTPYQEQGSFHLLR